jgi:DNA-binding NtrC family response regulator
LVEDSPEVIELFRGFLAEDVCLISATSAEKAREILAKEYKELDFIFVDALLPPDGLISSLQLVRDWRGDCLAILVAISADMEYALMLRSIGCHRWLEKNSDIGERVNNIINES